MSRQRVAPGASVGDRIRLHTEIDANGCWIWTASIGENGYGRLTVDGKSGLYAHRLSYAAMFGAIPDDLQIDHLCRVRACCNPLHLEAVTPLENTRRGDALGVRATECPRGHAYDERNTYRNAGRRYCRTCAEAYRLLRKQVPYEEAMRRKRAGVPIVDLDTYFNQERAA